jgi:hypothetical protein
MKILPTGTSPPLARPREAGRGGASAAGFRQALGAASPPAAPATVAPAQPLAALDAVLAVQEAEDGLERRRRAIRRGYDLLDELEAIRDGLLAGTLPRTVLRRLDILIAEKRGRTDDPTLEALLDEIELRAAVELAKLEQRGG